MEPILDKRDIVRVEINKKHSKWVHNSSDDSFYSESNNTEKSTNERCSFHYPVLERWLQMAIKRFQGKNTKYNPLNGQNIAFTFHDKNTTGSINSYISANLMDAAQKLFRSGNNFIVTLYDWDLDILSENEIQIIFQSINNSFINQEFSDPLANTEHKALKTTIEAIIKPTNNQEIKENKNMCKKQVVNLNESDINKIVKEVVSTLLLEHSRTPYDDVMKENMTKSFETLEEGVKDVLGMLTGWRINTQGKSLSDYAKLFGYDTSAKRFIKALEHIRKAQKLINAAKNDMLGTYNVDLSTMRIPDYKRLPKDFKREFLNQLNNSGTN